MDEELNEITLDVIGCELSSYSPDEQFQISKQDLQSMLEDAYSAGHRAGVTTGY